VRAVHGTIRSSRVADVLVGGFGTDPAPLTIVNSTLDNLRFDLSLPYGCEGGSAALYNSTLVGTLAQCRASVGDATLYATVVRGSCVGSFTSLGYNIESAGDTCGFDHETDQVNVSADDLKLGPLQDNGGATETHALGEGSVAIDWIPAEDCVDADGAPLTTDQRGEPRDSMCDVGAFEVQP
jgi:hypothetical protein